MEIRTDAVKKQREEKKMSLKIACKTSKINRTMETRKFKTSAKCGGCVARIAEKLDEVNLPREAWSIDLSSPDKVLTIESELSDSQIIAAVTAAGFKAERLA